MSHDTLRSRAWCFTVNNWKVDERQALEELKCEYIVFGQETGDEGTPHLQGYIYFSSARTLKSLKKKTGLLRAHLEKAQGDSQKNYDYCTKDGTNIHERGTRPKTRQEKGEDEKTRWANIKDLAKAGALEEIEPKVFVQNYRTLKLIKQDHMQRPQELANVCGEWLWGPSGCGKTTLARTTYPDAFIKARTKWFDGYQGQETCIMDDMDPYNVSLGGDVKDWGDKWSFMAQHKGTSSWIRPKRFIITSQYPPEQIFSDPETISAIYRRYNVTKMAPPKILKKRAKRTSAFLDYENTTIHKFKKQKVTFSHDCSKHGEVCPTPQGSQESLLSQEAPNLQEARSQVVLTLPDELYRRHARDEEREDC